MKAVSNLVFSKGLALSNVSFGLLYVLYFSLIGANSPFLQALLPKYHLSYFLGGVLGSYAINTVAN